jgi:protein phosphatase
MGTTFTAIVPLDDSNVLIGHIGDSRAYLLRGDALRRLTRDHSLVEDLVREGRITREQAEVHPQRAIITRALGIEPEIEVDLYTVHVTEGDRLLICSDGLTDMLSEPDISRIACEQSDGSVAAHALVDAANAAGGVDNITVVLLDVVEVEDDGGFEDHGAALADPVPDSQPLTDSSLGTSSQGAEGTPGADRSGPRRLWHLTRSTLRVLAVVVPIVVIVGIAFGAVWYRATHSYFVNQAHGEVVIERGVPGGILWFESTIVERTGLKTGTLTKAERLRLGNGFCETSSRSNARACVDELKARRPAASTTTNDPSTSTSTPKSRTTTTTAPATPS